ncbi:MAG: hypothetical protein DMF26_02850 [Verrucomicrobia bacterium]|nr:MAG: hypothetical protein DMF26_02850 [Verrucomicrobiota bacterium]
MQGESSPRPTKNSFADITPLRLCRNFTHDNSLFVTGRIRKRNVKVAACHFHSDNAGVSYLPLDHHG